MAANNKSQKVRYAVVGLGHIAQVAVLPAFAHAARNSALTALVSNDPEKLRKLEKINTFHLKQFAYFVDRLRDTPDGDGSLLDHSMLLYGSGISDSNIHMHDNLPLVLVGRAGGRIKGGRHVTYAKDTPVTNLFLNMLDIVGVPVEKLGDSTGPLEYLTDL